MYSIRIHQAFVTVAVLTALLAGAGTAHAGIEPTPFQESPLVGGGLDQTLRIIITGTADLCQATLSFRNQKGESVPQGVRLQSVSLKKGESAFRDQVSKRTTLIYGFPPDPFSPVSGETFLAPTGVAYGQTVRLGGVAGPIPDDGSPAPPCEVQAVLTPVPDDGRPALKQIKLAPGEAISWIST